MIGTEDRFHLPKNIQEQFFLKGQMKFILHAQNFGIYNSLLKVTNKTVSSKMRLKRSTLCLINKLNLINFLQYVAVASLFNEILDFF